MMAILEWATLLVCCAALLLRVPDAVQGRNRTVFGILLLATLCSVLAVSEVYAAVDAALGGRHLTSLILRYLVFATALLIGLRITQGLADGRGHRLLAGAPGRWVLALCCLAVAATFGLADAGGPVPGPPAAPEGGDAALAPWYTAAGRTYPAFVSLILVPPLLAVVRSQQPRLVRTAALLVLVGAVFAVLTLPVSLVPAGWAGGLGFVNYAAVLGYVVGLVLFWFSGLIAADRKPPGNAKDTLRRNQD